MISRCRYRSSTGSIRPSSHLPSRDSDDVIDIGIDERSTLGVNVTEDEDFVGAWNARADVALGEGPDSSGGKNTVRFGEPLPQSENMGFCCAPGFSLNGRMNCQDAPSFLFRRVRV